MEWYETLGIDENPLEIDPLEQSFCLIGKEQQAKEAIYAIHAGNILAIEGKQGTGKTSLLRHVIDNFRGKGKVIYIDAKKLSKRLDISELIYKKPKGMILLLDNIDNISNKNNEKLRYYYDEDRIKSIIFAAEDFNKANISNAIKDRISNIIKLDPIKEDEAINILKQKLSSNKSLLPLAVLKKLFKQSATMTDFISRCNLLCSYVVENNKKKAIAADVSRFLKISDKEIVKDEIDITLCSDCSQKLININGNWRCDNCDQYCMGCGALVDENDKSCPGCGNEFELEV